MNVIVAVISFVGVGLFVVDKISTLLGVVLVSVLISVMCLIFITTDVVKLARGLFSPQKSLPKATDCSLERPVALNFCSRFLIEFTKRSLSYDDASKSNRTQNSVLPYLEINSTPSTSKTENNALTCTNSTVSEEIKVCVDNIIRVYIKSWYAYVGANQDFVRELHYVLDDLFVALYNSISTVNALKFVENSLLICHHHLASYLQAAELARQKVGLEAFKVSTIRKEEIQKIFKMRYPVQNGNSEEGNYLKNLAGIVVDSLGPVDLLTCTVLHTLVVDIIAHSVLQPLVDFVCDPNWMYLILINVLSSDKNPTEEKYSSYQNGVSSECPESEIEDLKIADSEVIASREPEKVVLPQLIVHSDSVFEKLSEDTSSEISEAELLRDFKRRSPSVASSGSDSSAFHLTVLKPEASQTSLDSKEERPGPSNPEYSNISSEPWDCLDYNQLSVNCIPLGTKGKASSNINLCDDDNDTIIGDDGASADTEAQICKIKRSHSLDFLSQVYSPALIPLSNFDIVAIKQNRKYKRSDSKQKISSQNDGSPVEEAEEAIEIDSPPLFININISGTKQQMEPTRGTYTLYIIQYDGLFIFSGSMNESKKVRQSVIVKRRFREFLTLHSRLEDNPKFKKYIKGIKGPSKWLPTMFSNLDRKNIEERMQFLEQYLKQLCKIEVISKSLEMREFLAYGVDASIAYVKKAPELNVPRIDKMFVKGVKGAIDLLQKALPILPPDSPINYDDEYHKTLIPGFGKRRKSDGKHEVDFVYGENKNVVLTKRISAYTMSHDLNSSIDFMGKPELSPDQTEDSFNGFAFPSASPLNENHINSENSNIPDLRHDETDSSFEDLKQAFLEEIPLASLVIDFIVKCVRDDTCLVKKSSVVVWIKKVIGQYMDKHLSKFAELIFSEKYVALYLHFLHESLWTSPSETSQFSTLDEASTERLKSDAINRIRNFISGFMVLNMLVSSNQLEDTVATLLEALQDPQLNRCLFYNLCDLLLDEMFQTRTETP